MFGFEQLDKILSILVKDEVSIYSDQCPRTLHRKNSCTKCEQICPVNAIQLENGIELNLDACNECGLCVSACPNGVFELNKLSDKDILKQIKLIKAESTNSDGKLLFACKERHSSGDPSDTPKIVINCLGRLHESLLLGAVYFGFPNVLIDVSKCELCYNKGALEEILNNIKKSASILNSLNIDFNFEIIKTDNDVNSDENTDETITAGIDQNDSSQDADFRFSRRGFLDHIRKKSVEKSTDFVIQSVPLADEKKDAPIPQRLPTKRLHLVQLIKGLKKRPSEELKADESSVGESDDLPFKKITITDSCNICDFCSKFCPTEAMVKKDIDGSIKLYFNSAYCTGCNVCVDVCPDKAIILEKDSKLELSYNLIKSAEIKKCRICGFKFSAEDSGDLCRFCKKKEELAGSMF